jgi:hypothetical protein
MNLIGEEIKWNGNSYIIVTNSNIELQIWNEENDVVYQFEKRNIPEDIQNQIKTIQNGTRKRFY